MKHGHPSREHEHEVKHRERMEHLREQAQRGGEHLREHHHEERREVDRGHNHERGHHTKGEH